MWQRIEKSVSTEKAIQAPFTFFYVRDNDWSESHNWDYWNKNFTSATSVNNTATLKTVYDPSISGFTLPKTAAFTGFTHNGENTVTYDLFNVSGSFIKGWNFYTDGWKSGNIILFYALGIRDTASGRSSGFGFVAFVTERNDLWSSGAYSVSFSRVIDFSSSFVDPQAWDYRSYGLTIRSVKE